jgi:hypothetical protein
VENLLCTLGSLCDGDYDESACAGVGQPNELWKMHIKRQLGQETCPYASNQMYSSNIAN